MDEEEWMELRNVRKVDYRELEDWLDEGTKGKGRV